MASDVKTLLEITKQLRAFKHKAAVSMNAAWRTTRNCQVSLKGIEATGQSSPQEMEILEKAILAQVCQFLNVNYRLSRRLKALTRDPMFLKLAAKHGLGKVDRGNLRWFDTPLDLIDAADNFVTDNQKEHENE
ncbi:MAG: hypothetical protein WC647_04000 [Desulfomonilaceae bacterium]|jgi:hypothetical protein